MSDAGSERQRANQGRRETEENFSRGGAEPLSKNESGARRRAEQNPKPRLFQVTKNSASPRLRVIPFVVAAALLIGTPSHAAAVPPVTITGAVKTPTTLSFAALQKMPATSLAIRQHTEKADVAGTFSGPLLWTLIGHAGWKNGQQKNAMLLHTILVTGKDGYAVVLSEGEIDPTLEGKKVILAVTQDGKPMAAPRLFVPGDSGAPRAVHDVVSVAVQ